MFFIVYAIIVLVTVHELEHYKNYLVQISVIKTRAEKQARGCNSERKGQRCHRAKKIIILVEKKCGKKDRANVKKKIKIESEGKKRRGD